MSDSVRCNGVNSSVRFRHDNLFPLQLSYDLYFSPEFQAAAFQFMQTIYDSMAFGLIIFRTLRDAMQNNGTDTLRTLIAKHGLAYYV